MNITVNMTDFGKLAALMNKMRPAGRAQLNRVGSNAVMARIQRHIHAYARGKHQTATTLGAPPTGHYEKGAAAITASASAERAEVLIPIPGIGRAYHDIVITTPTKNGKRYVTIPKHRDAYGQTVEKLRTRGWKIFRPGNKKVLLGYRHKGDKPVILFTLAEAVHQRRDQHLLPSQQDLGNTFAGAIKTEINRVLSKASPTTH